MSVFRQPRCAAGGGGRSGAHARWRQFWTARPAASTGPGIGGRAHRGVQPGSGPSRSEGGRRCQPSTVVTVVPTTRAAVRAAGAARSHARRSRHLVLGTGGKLATHRAHRRGRERGGHPCRNASGLAIGSRGWLAARFLPRAGAAVARAGHSLALQPHLPAGVYSAAIRSLRRSGAVGLDGPMDIQYRARWHRRAHRDPHPGHAASRRGPAGPGTLIGALTQAH